MLASKFDQIDTMHAVHECSLNTKSLPRAKIYQKFKQSVTEDCKRISIVPEKDE